LIILFLNITVFDIIDIIIVAYLLYSIYMLIRGSVAFNIFIGIALLYFSWLTTRALDMEMTSSILGQVIGIGAIALLIVFQQEVRRFLILIGNKYFITNNKFSLEKLFSFEKKISQLNDLEPFIESIIKFSKEKTGALIVFSRKMDLSIYSQIGDEINASVSSRLIETIFQKDSPLHDGAIIIQGNKIKSARCVLPISENPNLPADFGMRHRSALGMSEVTDAIIVIVSEQTGKISVAIHGELIRDIDIESLKELLINEL